MSLVYSRTDSGLVLAEQAEDEAALGRALKQHDPHLELQAWPSPAHGCLLYKVIARVSGDQPPRTIYVHQLDDGTPLPLSSRLLDEVKRLDRNSRGEYIDEDELNRRRREQTAHDEDRDIEAIVDDWDFKHGRPVLPRSVSLRMARDRRRGRGEKC